MAFFKDMGKGIARMNQKMAVAVGRATETKDVSFEQTRTQFKNFEASVGKVQKAAKAYQAALGAFHKAQSTLSMELLALYTEHGSPSPDEPDLSPLVQKAKSIIDSVDGAKERAFGSEYERRVMEPLNKYVADLKEVDRRISLRATKVVDMDRHTRKLAGTDQVKHPEEFNRETSKVRQFTAEYNQINEALIKDLPMVMNHRNRVLNSVFASAMILQNEYYCGCAQVTAAFVPELSFIDVNKGVTYNLLDHLTPLDTPPSLLPPGGASSSGPTSSPYSAPPSSSPYSAPPPQDQYGGYGAPAPAYGAPAPSPGGYGAPAPGPAYGAPAPGPGYGAPAPGPAYGAPAPGPGYGAPAPGPGYGAPAPGPGYGAPAPGRGAPAPRGAAPMAPGRGAPAPRGGPARPPPQVQPQARVAVALYDFAAEDATELGFRQGDTITIISADPGAEWIQGELNGRRGLLPASYVKL